VQSRQKSYADDRRREISFKVGDFVYLKVSPMRVLCHFKLRGKFTLGFIGPFKIMEKKCEVACQLELPPQLSDVHHVFHVSQLKKCLRVSKEQVPMEDLDGSEDRSRLIPLERSGTWAEADALWSGAAESVVDHDVWPCRTIGCRREGGASPTLPYVVAGLVDAGSALTRSAASDPDADSPTGVVAAWHMVSGVDPEADSPEDWLPCYPGDPDQVSGSFVVAKQNLAANQELVSRF
jgi:hypothetical protein